MTGRIWIPKVWLAIGFVGLLAWIAVWAVPEFTPQRVAAHEREIRTAIARHHVVVWGLAVALYTLVSLIPGTSGKSILAGWLFGFSEGLLIVMIGLTIAAHVMFAISRYILRDAIRARLSARLVRWDRKLAEEGSWFLLTVRWAHSPYTLVNYACGVSSISARTFGWTTVAGLLPGSIIFVWMGSRLPTLEQLIAGGLSALIDPWLWTALAATAVFPPVIRHVIVRRRRRRSARSGSTDSTAHSNPVEARSWKASC